MRRTRRRPRVLWLPVHGRDFSDVAEQSAFGNGVGGILTVPNDGLFVTEAQAVTFDYSDSASAEEGTDFRSLHELAAGNAYRLRRIVGKLHAACTIGDEQVAGIPLVQLAAGFIINRTDPDGNLAPAGPFGTLDVGGPLHQDAAEDPWIWRRTWLLSPIQKLIVLNVGTAANLNVNVNQVDDVLGNGGQFPQTTADYGSVQDGPHIDQKTARVIGPQERLMFWMQARMVNAGPSSPTARINWNLDLRILASLRTQVGNRRNASR